MTAPSMITVLITGAYQIDIHIDLLNMLRGQFYYVNVACHHQTMLVDKPDFHGEKVCKVSFSCLTPNVQL